MGWQLHHYARPPAALAGCHRRQPGADGQLAPSQDRLERRQRLRGCGRVRRRPRPHRRERIRTRDTDNNGSTNYTLDSDDAGNLTDDAKDYEFVYDGFNRLMEIRKTSNQALVTEYRYNGEQQTTRCPPRHPPIPMHARAPIHATSKTQTFLLTNRKRVPQCSP